MGSKRRLILVIQQIPVDRVGRRLLAVLAVHLVQLGLAGPGRLVVLDFRLVLVVLLVLVRLVAPLVLGWNLSGFRPVLVVLAVLDFLVDRLVLHHLLVQLVPVALGRLLVLELLVVHQVRVGRIAHLGLAVRVAQRGMIDSWCLEAGMVRQLLLELHLVLAVLVHLVDLAGQRVRGVLGGPEDNLEQLEYIDSGLAMRLLLDAFGGRCC